MGRVNTPKLSQDQLQELEFGFRNGSSHAFRIRCKAILLKAEGRKSKEVGQIVSMCSASVNSWLKRYLWEGIEGLHTRPGRGRKPKITKEVDQEAILRAIQKNRQRLQTAKADWEAQSGKSVSKETFRRFLKTLVEDISE